MCCKDPNKPPVIAPNPHNFISQDLEQRRPCVHPPQFNRTGIYTEWPESEYGSHRLSTGWRHWGGRTNLWAAAANLVASKYTVSAIVLLYLVRALIFPCVYLVVCCFLVFRALFFFLDFFFLFISLVSCCRFRHWGQVLLLLCFEWRGGMGRCGGGGIASAPWGQFGLGRRSFFTRCVLNFGSFWGHDLRFFWSCTIFLYLAWIEEKKRSKK